MNHQHKPNILFIITDQWRGDCLSITGHPVVETPNLDMVAQQGIIFTHAYSSCPSCIAARASIFAGLSPSSHGRLGYQDRVPWRYDNMLPEVLGNNGYQTYCIGKTHFFPQRAHFGFQGLESYEGKQNFDGRFINDYWEWLKEQTGGRGEENAHGLSHNGWPARPSHLPDELHNNSWVAARAEQFLMRRDPTRPFFLNLSFHRPHPPIDPPKVYWDMYQDTHLPDLPIGDWAAKHAVSVNHVDAWQGKFEKSQIDRARRGYYAQISHIDNQIGRVLTFIARLNCGPLIVVFTSDHGEMLGDHNLFRKTYAYEGSARVPLIISMPDKPATSSPIVETPAVLEDIYPTILEAAGVDLSTAGQDRDGMSLLPLYREDTASPKAAIHKREFIHGEHSACYDPSNAMQFMTDGREKYIWNPVTGGEQLFDLAEDPQEFNDLARDGVCKDHLLRWRERMIHRLAERPQDNLSDGKMLLSGTSPPAVRPELLD